MARRDGGGWASDEEKPVNPRKARTRFDEYGERVPPVHRPWKRAQCQWVPGTGWVANPGDRYVNWGRY